MANTTGIKIDNNVTSEVLKIVSKKLAYYFEEKRGQKFNDQNKELMQKGVTEILSPLGNFSKDSLGIIRECASETNMKLSFKEKCLRIFDLIVSIISDNKDKSRVINDYKQAARDIASNMRGSVSNNEPAKPSKSSQFY